MSMLPPPTFLIAATGLLRLGQQLPRSASWKFLVLVFCLCSFGNLLPLASGQTLADSSPPSAVLSSENYFDQGLTAFQRGSFDEAVSSWTEASRLYEREDKSAEQVTALSHLSRAYSALGQYKQAVKSLEVALELVQKSDDRAAITFVLAELGNAHIAIGPPDTAEAYLKRSLDMAKELDRSSLSASILNNLGNLFATQNKATEAIAAYRESVDLAEKGGERQLAARALINGAVALRQNKESQESKALLDKARNHLRQLKPSRDAAFALVNLGLAYRDLRPSLRDATDQLLLQASETVNEAGAMAESIGDRRTASYAWGYLGTLYEDERRYREALQLTRKAVVAAQQVNAPESLYRWQWQTGRLLKKQGMIDHAIAAYRRGVYTLQSIRPELAAGFGSSQTSFRETMAPVYFELVDLLLQQAASEKDINRIGPYLVEAREVIELQKVAELRDYFRDDCVDMALAKVTQLDVVSPTAVVVYPILLQDRTELLLSLPTGLKRFTVQVGADVLTREVRQFRLKLEKRTTREYLPHGQQLYKWLIEPLEPELTSLQIDTLVFVPDGPLRTIPMGALHDGKQFLVAKYALGITPGLSLTDPRPIRREQANVLAVGVTEPVQGYPPLPNVSAELQILRGLFKSTTLVDREFLLSNLEKKLKDEQFTIVHIASHGQFEGDVKKTFLLTFDDKLTMDRLDQFVGLFKFRDDPLELLALSACDTAAGDDRAALGLAGVAIKAGARSALASLWNINDQASSILVADFYRQFQDPSISRAVALQRAQLKMLSDPRYEHPGFWSPFLLLNNWL